MPVHLTCPTCQTTFTVRPYRAQTARFCSLACKHPEFPIVVNGDGTASIPLVGDDRAIRAYALIDATDAEWAAQWRWCLSPDGYTARDSNRTRLHRAILGLHSDALVDVDHINRDKLNNRRANLRVLPKGTNGQNKPSYQGSTSRHRGVCWDKSRGKWMAFMQSNGRRYTLGRFSSEEEAAQVARAARANAMPYAID